MVFSDDKPAPEPADQPAPGPTGKPVDPISRGRGEAYGWAERDNNSRNDPDGSGSYNDLSVPHSSRGNVDPADIKRRHSPDDVRRSLEIMNKLLDGGLQQSMVSLSRGIEKEKSPEAIEKEKKEIAATAATLLIAISKDINDYLSLPEDQRDSQSSPISGRTLQLLKREFARSANPEALQEKINQLSSTLMASRQISVDLNHKLSEESGPNGMRVPLMDFQ